MRARRRSRGFISINRSPLARKIITFNLLALIVLVAGVLWLNPVRDNLVLQRESGLVTEAQLIADVFEAQLPSDAPVNLVTGDGVDVSRTLAGLSLSPGIEVFVFDQTGTLVATTVGQARPGTVPGAGLERAQHGHHRFPELGLGTARLGCCRTDRTQRGDRQHRGSAARSRRRVR